MHDFNGRKTGLIIPYWKADLLWDHSYLPISEKNLFFQDKESIRQDRSAGYHRGSSFFNLRGTNSFFSGFIEHFIYSAALAVIVGMFFSRFKGTDPSWIIIAVDFVQDIDFGLQELRTFPGITLPFEHG